MLARRNMKKKGINSFDDLSTTEKSYFRDVFLSHSSSDKDPYVYLIVKSLEKREISYWFDEAEMQWGDSLLDKISYGLEHSRYVLVFISEAFLSRNWPMAELKAALSREINSGETRVLPIFLCDSETILKKIPFLSDKLWFRWENNPDQLISQLERRIGRSFQAKWEFTHPADFRGHVWLKIMPKKEHHESTHSFKISWGRWQYTGHLVFGEDTSIILDFRKIAEKQTWPIHFEITPPSFVVSGRGSPVIDINKDWKCIDRSGGYRKSLLDRRIQSALPETDDGHARLIANKSVEPTS